jgi:hypothetical protein
MLHVLTDVRRGSTPSPLTSTQLASCQSADRPGDRLAGLLSAQEIDERTRQ